ncbi:hypothetical protein MLD38_000453 [Melastoma candidum]|uniref:Uncharacterized protein n=2 Tax=Melastoma candidum TaxID=119954 RepID=A0ACB9N4C0_9MYRT|nr:hypothetical protein MLD38_029348 [Melastoma candidum]KAI4388089.1 hypothetical protein MLD38_000453 [Melastoma candidum]
MKEAGHWEPESGKGARGSRLKRPWAKGRNHRGWNFVTAARALWVVECTAIMAIALANGGVSNEHNSALWFLPFTVDLIGGAELVLTRTKYLQGKAPDWQDFVGIVALRIINSTISFVEENNAGNVAAALMAGLAPKTKVFERRQVERAGGSYPGSFFSRAAHLCFLSICSGFDGHR